MKEEKKLYKIYLTDGTVLLTTRYDTYGKEVPFIYIDKDHVIEDRSHLLPKDAESVHVPIYSLMYIVVMRMPQKLGSEGHE